ncbi:MAG: hypothetical protein LW850_02755 [Planctomycetaceae bacterium]|nr:hypothetical protein [Planctomycetaceae bacterium]
MIFPSEAKFVHRTFQQTLGWVIVCLLSLVCFAGLTDSATAADLDLPKAMQGVGIEQKLGIAVPEHLAFTNAQGQSTSLSKLLQSGKPVLLTLNYSNCPGMCVAQLNGLVPQDLFDQHDPSGWEFWVGTSESIRQLTEAVGFQYTYDAKHKQFNHPSAAIFLSPGGKVTRYVFEIGFVPETLKMAFIEAGQGTIGTPLDMIALWCVHYDPDENKYTASARKLMSLGGGAFVLLVLLVTVPYWLIRSAAADAKDNLIQTSTVDSTENQS